MKTSTKKSLFLIGGILIILNILVSIITYFALVASPDFVASVLTANNIPYTTAELMEIFNIYVVIFTVMMLISVIFRIIFSALYFQKSSYTAEKFEQKRNSNLIVSVVVLVLVGITPGILGIIASASGSTDDIKPEQAVSVAPAQSEQESEVQPQETVLPTELQAKIEQLKKLKASGAISEEEYEQLFSSLIK